MASESQMHPGLMGQTLSEKVNADGRKTYQHRSASLFAAVDSDGSGQIDKNEFGKLYDLIKVEVQAELDKEAQLEKKAKNAKRMTKMLGMIAAVLLGVVAVSVAANFAAMFYVVDRAKDTAVKEGTLATRDGQTLATENSVDYLDLSTLPNNPDERKYNNLQSVLVESQDSPGSSTSGATGARKIVGWKWFSATQMDLLLADGTDLMIHEGQVWHVAVYGAINFKADGTPIVTGTAAAQKDTTPAMLTEAASFCTSLGCPAENCVISTAAAVGLHSASCFGKEIWNYKDEPVTPAKPRRKLIVPLIAIGLNVGMAGYTAYKLAGGDGFASKFLNWSKK